MPLTVVVLAAGLSRRLGRPKQLVELEGETLVHRAARVACEANVGTVRVVHSSDAVADAVRDLGVELRRNLAPEDGLASSIRSGLEGHAGPVLLMTCDQYEVPAAHLRALAGALRPPYLASASRYADTVGVPAAFAPELLDALRALEGDRGAKSVLQAQGERVAHVKLPGGERDVDVSQHLPQQKG